MRAAGAPGSPTLVRLGALIECLIAVLAVVSTWAWARWLLAASYIGFAAFVGIMARRPAVVSCGCFGGEGAAPSNRHVAVNACLAVLVAFAAATGTPGLGTVLSDQPLAAVPFVVVAVSSTWLVYLLLSKSSQPHLGRQATLAR